MSVYTVSILIFVSILIDSDKATLDNQEFLIESSKRDIGTVYSLEISADTRTMTLTMEGPQNIWMGVSFGTEDMFDVAAYVYYLDEDTAEWVFAERFLTDEEGAGDLIEIIDQNAYDMTNENNTTRIIFTRPWIGAHSTSFTLSDDDTEFLYGFARGIGGILADHTHDGRSHSVYTLIHSDSELNCSLLDGTECHGKFNDDGDQLCGYNSVTEDCYAIIRRSNTNLYSDGSNNTSYDMMIIILCICGVTFCIIFGVCVGFHHFLKKANQRMSPQRITSTQNADDLNLISFPTAQS
eukprot:UN02820